MSCKRAPRFVALALLSTIIAADPARADETGLTDEYLSDAANIDLGHELFRQQCSMCHGGGGGGAYPGKAPKLHPKKLSAEDIYLRITYGFRRMPAWEEVFSDEERMAITAYMKSPIFDD